MLVLVPGTQVSCRCDLVTLPEPSHRITGVNCSITLAPKSPPPRPAGGSQGPQISTPIAHQDPDLDHILQGQGLGICIYHALQAAWLPSQS